MLIQHRRINISYAIHAGLTIAFMNMPENVDADAEFLYFAQQIAAAYGVARFGHPVEDAVGRPVGNQYVSIRRNQGPMVPNVCPPMPIECPIEKPWGNGAAPKADAFNFHTCIVQVMHMRRNQRLKSGRKIFGHEIVVAGNAHQMREILLSKPIHKIGYLLGAAAFAEITGVYQHIAGGQPEGMVLTVGIGDKNEFHKRQKLTFMRRLFDPPIGFKKRTARIGNGRLAAYTTISGRGSGGGVFLEKEGSNSRAATPKKRL